MTTYAEALKFVLQWEGGFVDDVDDHGGRTNKGITQAVYDAYLRSNGQAPKDDRGDADGQLLDLVRADAIGPTYADDPLDSDAGSRKHDGSGHPDPRVLRARHAASGQRECIGPRARADDSRTACAPADRSRA